MDLKEAGNVLFLVGRTANEFGGSHLHLVTGGSGGEPPRVDLKEAPRVFAAMHQAITKGLVRSCHDLSEGGLAVALAEMAFAGGLGVDVSLSGLGKMDDTVALFSESNTRFLVEVPPESADDFAAAVPFTVRLGQVADSNRVMIKSLEGRTLIDESIEDLKASWQSPLAWE
jgi:phosphoribosylformylglycinamidine synthase